MPFPRYCCMRKDNSGSGFGFALVVTINETGHFIEDVKPGSLADKAGLRNGDLVVEVNGRNILTLSHPEVVEFIRQCGDEVCLLVLDEEARAFYEDRSIIVSHTLPEVKIICTWKEQSTPSDETKDNSKVTLQEFLLQKPEVEEEQTKVISTPDEIISQTSEITPTIVPSEHPAYAPVSLPPAPPQHIEGMVTEIEKKAEEKMKEMPEVDRTSNVEEPQIKGEEFQQKLTIGENQVETQEDVPKTNEVQLNVQKEEKTPKVEEEVPMELVAEVVQEAVEKAKTESVAQSHPLTTSPNFSPKVLLQSRQSSGSRCTPARKACMTKIGTFADRAKAFDSL
nr:pdz domain containing protein [Hymenolepis microstoma]